MPDRGRLIRRDPASEGPAGNALIALLLILVGLLDVLAAGSKMLIGALRGGIDGWMLTALLLCLMGLCHFALARGVLTLRAWVPLLAGLLTTLVLGFGVLRFTQDEGLDLALTTIFVLALPTNLGVLGWSQLPAIRAQLRAGDEAGWPSSPDRGSR